MVRWQDIGRMKYTWRTLVCIHCSAAIVLVHTASVTTAVGSLRLAHYFSNLPEALQAAGNRVVPASARRVALLSVQQQRLPRPPRSTSRYLIGQHGRTRLPLFDVAVKHGRPCVDIDDHRHSTPRYVIRRLGVRNLEVVLKPVFHFLGILRQAFYDLTTANCRKFNDEVLTHLACAPLRGWRYEGDWRSRMAAVAPNCPARGRTNDGVVSVASATYASESGLGRRSLESHQLAEPEAWRQGLWKDRSQFAALLRNWRKRATESLPALLDRLNCVPRGLSAALVLHANLLQPSQTGLRPDLFQNLASLEANKLVSTCQQFKPPARLLNPLPSKLRRLHSVGCGHE